MWELLIKYISRLGWYLINFHICILYVFGSNLLRVNMGGITIEWDYVAIELKDINCKGFRFFLCYWNLQNGSMSFCMVLGSFGIRSVIKNIGSMIGRSLMCLRSLVYFGIFGCRWSLRQIISIVNIFIIILCLNFNKFLHDGIEGGHELKAIVMVLILYVENLPTNTYIYYKLYVYVL
jgi:hypothetical protein